MKHLLMAGIAAVTLMAAPLAANADMHKDGHAAEKSAGNIVAVASANPDFSTLVAAVKAAGLVEALSGEGPFTVFAPTNAAFEALPPGALEDLLKPENKEKLAGILKYHVVSGKVMAADIAPGASEVATLQGTTLAVEAKDGAVTVDGAKVVAADVAADNGVIHVIDKVVMPE